MCRSLRNHEQHTRVVLGLELLDDVGPLGGAHAAVDDRRGVASLGHLLLQHLKRMPVGHKHQHLAVGRGDHVQQFPDPVGHVELDHLLIIRIYRPLRNLQQFVEHGGRVDGRDFGACGDGHHLLAQRLVVLGLLRRERHLAGAVEHVRQVKTLVLGEPDGWLQNVVHDLLSLLARHPLVLRDLEHHLVAERAEEPGHALGVDQLGQTVRIERGLGGRSTRHEPQPCGGFDEAGQRLPALGRHALDRVGFVNDNEIEAPFLKFGSDYLYAVKVDDDKLVVALDHSLPLSARTLRNRHRAVHHRLEQVRAPCRLHDGHRTDHQYPFDPPLGHEVVRSPRSGRGLARASFVEHKASGVQGEELCGGLLVLERAVHARPLVPAGNR